MNNMTQCSKHPEYLDTLTEADATGESLPAPAAGCPVCARVHTLFIETSEVLQWREQEEPELLSPDWQLGVWMRLDAEQEIREPEGLVIPLQHKARPARPSWVGRGVAVSMAAILLALIAAVAVWSTQEPPAPDKPAKTVASKQEKSSPRSGVVELMAYSLQGDKVHTLKPDARISSGDQLSFDYLNVPDRKTEEMRYLTVVALVRSQEAQRGALAPDKDDLRWIAQSEPIEATRKSQPRVLGAEDTMVDAPPGKMTIYGLFSHQPLSADEVEQVLLAQRSPKPSAGIGVARLDLRVD